MARTIITESPTNGSELKQYLEKIQEKDKELSFRAQRALEHLQSITTLGPKKAKELEQALTKLSVPRMKEQHVNKIIDVLPATTDDVKTALQGYALTVTNDNCKKIADTVAEFV